MRRFRVLAILLACCLPAFAQGRVTPEDKALLERLSRDPSFVLIRPGSLVNLTASNTYKQRLFMAYLVEAPNALKARKRDQVGMEGQYKEWYFVVDHGKVTIVEAYYGDPSGSKALQYVRVRTPTELKIGYVDKNWKFVALALGEVPKDKELVIDYSIPSTGAMSWF